LNLTVNSTLTSTTNTAICTNQLPYIWNGQSITTAGTYTANLTGISGCDSIATLNLTVNSTLTSTTNTTICTNQLPYSWNGQNITAAGTYTANLTSISGCDSIATLNLTVNSTLTSTTNTAICTNQLPYTWNGQNITAAGTYTANLISISGCDSIATLNLTVNSTLTSTTNTTICTNQLPYIWNGQSLTAAGTYTANLISAAGCDSIATLILAVSPTLTSTTNTTICSNQLPYTWNGKQYNIAGTYKETLVSAAGCDSVASLTLIVKSSSAKTENVSICADSYVLPNGTIAITSGVYKSTFVSLSGCDSIITTNLTLNTAPNLVVNNPVVDCKQASVDLTATDITAGSVADLTFSYFTDVAATKPLVNPGAVTTSGTYYIKAINAAGCSVVKPVNVQVSSIPTASISGSTICQGAKATLTVKLSGKPPFAITYTDSTTSHTVTAITGTTYQWQVSPATNATYTLISVSDAYCSNNSIGAAAVVTVIPSLSAVRYPDVITSANQPTPLKARLLGVNSSYKWSPGTGLNETGTVNPVFNYTQGMDYLINITSQSGCVVVDTQSVMLIARGPAANEPPDLWVPTAWSPHKKDGHNDYLFPFTRNIVELRYFRVFDRWGQLMFETNQLGVGWDGIYKGVPQVMDTYTWTVEAVGNDGTVFKRAGNAMLLR
jgi:gliding motility-associated-like protein